MLQICERHATAYVNGSCPIWYFRRDEMTLLIRIFGLNRQDVGAAPARSLNAFDLNYSSAQTLRSLPDALQGPWNSYTDTNETAYTDSLPPMSSNRATDFDNQPDMVESYVDFSELDSLSDIKWPDSE